MMFNPDRLGGGGSWNVSRKEMKSPLEKGKKAKETVLPETGAEEELDPNVEARLNSLTQGEVELSSREQSDAQSLVKQILQTIDEMGEKSQQWVNEWANKHPVAARVIGELGLAASIGIVGRPEVGAFAGATALFVEGLAWIKREDKKQFELAKEEWVAAGKNPEDFSYLEVGYKTARKYGFNDKYH